MGVPAKVLPLGCTSPAGSHSTFSLALSFVIPDAAQRRSGIGEPRFSNRGQYSTACGSPIPARASLGRDDDGQEIVSRGSRCLTATPF